ncbi:MAG TPA: BatA domain-containing protein [Phycisphaerae bacterium]|nr:BatA domain-containing protein [Phycisphaerae bacterium]
MGFLNQIMLLGALGVAVPILIHLLNRYRYREIDWGAMELLRRAMVVRSRRVRIEDLILLILRCLAVGLLAVSMARPTLSAAGAKFLGGESRVGMVIALDGSYSMAHRPGVHSRFDVALQKAREVIRTLQPGDQVSVVLMGQRPRAILRNVSFDAERIEEKLRDLAVLPERLNLELCMEQVADLIAEVRAPVKECYVLSDSQDLSWRQVSDRARKSMGEIAAAGRLYYLSVATGTAENLALTSFEMTGGATRQHSTVRYLAEVRNSGRRVVRNVPVTLQVDKKTADRRIVDAVQPGRSASVVLYAKFDTAGNVRVSARIDQDALPIDDVRHAAALVRRQIRVLVVDGDPGRDLHEAETFYLMNALVPDPTKPSQASLRVKRVAYVELPLHRPGDYDIVILANVPDIRTAQTKALLNFVRRGGGLIVFLGDKVNAQFANVRMKLGDAFLLPAELTKVLSAPASRRVGWPLELADTEHPLGRLLARLPKQLVDEARVRKLFGVKLPDGSRAILKAAGTDAPLLVEKRLGRGGVLLFTSSADRDWGSLAISPPYLILLHESIAYLTRQSHERQFVVGEPLVIPVPSQVVSEQFTLVDPAGQGRPIQATESETGRAARCEPPEAVGFYELKYDEKADPLMVAVNVNPVESDVTTLSDAELGEVMADLPLRVLRSDDLLTQVKQGRTGREMWRVLMLAALVILCVEGFLAWSFSRKLGQEESVLPKSAREEILGTREAA